MLRYQLYTSLMQQQYLNLLLYQIKCIPWFLKGDRTKDWENCLRQVTSFDSIERFRSVANHFFQPSDNSWGSDFYVFREGIKPMWEDEQNVKGGRWLVMVDQQLLDHYWMEMLLALVGEQFGEICGSIVNVRLKSNKIALWTRVVKYARDTRYDENMASTHDSKKMEAIAAEKIADIFDQLPTVAKLQKIAA